MSNKIPEVQAKDVRYFNSIRNYTLALLNGFNAVKLYVNQDNSQKDKVYIVPITFGNYEKSVILQDINEKDMLSGNFNFLPRIVLSFENLSKAPERQTNKFQKLSKRVFLPDDSNVKMMVSYNSLAYDFHYTLLVQSRGLTQASQLTEEILSYFKPTMNLNILECPIFNEKTETQIQISDPAFEINKEFDEKDVNIISVTFDITVRGNIYSPIEMSAPVTAIHLFTHVWDSVDYHDSKLSSYYNFEKDLTSENSNKLKLTERIFDGTRIYTPDVELKDEEQVILKRPDYQPPQIENKIK